MTTAITPILPDWINKAANLSISVTLLRVSSDSADKLAANADSNAEKLGHRESMQRLRALGGAVALLGSDAEGIALRRELGVVEILRAHANEHADLSRKVMGYLWAMEAEQDLLLFITDSAAENNISRPGDAIKQNAVAEILVQLATHPKIGQIHIPEWSRLTRSNAHGSRIVAAASDGRCKIYEGKNLIDFLSPSGQMITAIKTANASGERNAIVERQVRGTLGKLTRDEFAWPYAPSTLPPGYAIKERMRTKDEGRSIRVATVCADSMHTQGWTEFFKAVANGVPHLQAGRVLAKHKIPCRGVRLANKTYDQLTDSQLANAALTFSKRRIYEMLRSRKYISKVSVPLSLEAGEQFHGHDVTDLDRLNHPNGYVGVVAQLPEHGIELSDSEWVNWDERTSSRQSREPRMNVPRRALVGTGFWRNGGSDYRITCQGATPWVYYKVEFRPVEQSVDKLGNDRGWKNGEGKIVLTASACDVEMALGRAIEAGAMKLIEQTAVLTILRRDKPDERAVEEVRIRRMSEIIGQITNAVDDVVDAQDALDRNPGDRRRTARFAEYQSILNSLEVEKAGLDAIDGQSVTKLVETGDTENVVEVDVGSLASLAGILQGGKGTLMPRVVNDTIREITRGSVRIEALPENPGIGVVKATIHWPSQDGESLAFDVCARVRLATRQSSPDFYRYAAAQLILEEGLSIEQASELFASKHSRQSVVLHAFEWLGSNGVKDHRLRRAILDCPIKETKAVAWALLTHTALPKGIDHEFAELIMRTYLSGVSASGSAGTWAQNIQLQRTALSAFASWGARGESIENGISVDVLARQIGCQTGELLRLAGRGNKVNCIRLFERHPLDARVLLPRRCPTCKDWLLHLLRTPETLEQDGLICYHCQGLPSGIKLPSDYLALWDAPLRDHNICDGQGTFLAMKSDYELGAPIPGESRLMRISEASTVLGIPQHRLREWSNKGLINSHRKGKGEDRYYHPDEIIQAIALMEPTHPAMMPTDELPEGYLLLSAAAKSLNVEVCALKDLALSTPWNKEPLPYQQTGGGRRSMYVVAKVDLAKINPAWLDSYSRERIFMAEAVRYTGLGASVLRHAIVRGQLKCARTAGTARFRYSELDEWMSGRGRLHKMLIPKHAAEAAGVSAETLSAAVKKGELKPEHTVGGHARFDPDKIRRWASKRL